MADMNKIKRIDGGVLKTQRAQDATIPLNVQTYDGSYTVTPTREQQTLETRNRMMTNNVTVEAAAITTDYDELENKPQINSVTLQGNVGLDELGIPTIASVEDKYTVPEGGIPASDLAEGVIPDVSGFYTKPSGGIPADDIADGVIPDVSGKLDAPSAAGTLGQVLTSDGEGGQTWEDPTGGGTTDYTDLDNKPTINSVTLEGDLSLSDLSIASASDLDGKQAKITASGILKGDGSGGVSAATAGTDYGTYSKPSGGIPSSDMASAVQTSLGKADTAYQKPSGGIPATDIASGVIPDISGKLDAPSTAGTNGQVLTSDGQGGQSWQTPSGGGSLPSVTSSDNGKILQVSSGAWAATNSLADKLDKPSATGLNTQILARDGNSGHKWKDLAATVMLQHGTNPIDQGIYLEEGNASQTNLYFKCQRLGFFYNNGASNVEDRWSTKWFNDIVTELNASTVTSPKGVTGCLQIPNDTALVFDIPSNKMKYVNRSSVTCDQVALFYCAYGRAENPHPLILEARIFQLQKAINNSISVNVKDFGAAGDGSTDDTQAIQNAIEHSHTNGGIVYFPSGTYKLSTALFNSSDSSLASALMCYSGQTLKGDNATLKAGAAAVTHIIYTYNASGATGYSGCSDVTIEGITFDGNSSLSSNITPVNLSHSENVLIKRCSFVNGRSWHSIEINSSHNVKVDGCTFSGNSNTEDVQIDSASTSSGNIGATDDTVCKDIEIFNCMFDVSAYPAIGNHTSAAHNNIRIHDNVFSGGTGASRGYIDFVAAQYNNDIYNNTFYTGAKGVVLANSTANSTVHDNRFISVTTPVSGGAVVYNNLVNDALNSIFVPTGYTFDGSKTNLNNVMTSQNIGSLTMCQYAVNATNRPSDDAGILLSGRNGGSGKYGWQIAFNNNNLFYRAYNNQSFGTWKTINMT